MVIGLTRGDSVGVVATVDERKGREDDALKFTARAIGAFRAAAEARAKSDVIGEQIALDVAAEYSDRTAAALDALAAL